MDPITALAKNGMPKSNLFKTTQPPKITENSSGFVFGVNVHERVTGVSWMHLLLRYWKFQKITRRTYSV